MNLPLSREQKRHRENGYHVETLSAGQVRPYGPTENKYIVICLGCGHGPFAESRVREYCTTEIKRADDPLEHSLLPHLIEFKQIGPRTYYYECGHEWTG